MSRIAVSAPDPFVFSEFLDKMGWSDTRSKTIRDPRLNAGETTGVFVVAGQSNATSFAPTPYTPSNAAKVDNLSIYDGGLYSAADPLLGCTILPGGPGVGNWVGRMADGLISAGIFQRVILIPVAVGGTMAADWNSQGLTKRLVAAGRRSAAVGLPITAFLWMQGESDTQNGTSQGAYAASLASIIASPRSEGFNAPWFVGKCTWLNGAVSSPVQAAQAAAVNGIDIFAGANTDTLGAGSRQGDNTHFTDAGSASVAALWVTAIDAVF